MDARRAGGKRAGRVARKLRDELDPARTLEMCEAVASEVDLAIGPERPLGEELVAEEVFSDNLMLVCDPRHRLASRQHVRWQEIEGESFIVSGPGAALRTMVDIDYALTIEPSMQVEHFTTMLALVAARQGITFSTKRRRRHNELPRSPASLTKG